MTTEMAAPEAPPATADSAAQPQSKLSIRDALKQLRVNVKAELESAGRVLEEASRSLERARQRVELVNQIEDLLGFEVLASERFPEVAPAMVEALKQIKQGTNGNGNGHSHEKPVFTLEDRVVAKSKKAQAEVEKIVGNLPPQLAALYKFLDSRRGTFTTKEQIAKKLDLSNDNQASPMITKLRAEGINVEAAKTLRSEGEEIPEGARGWRLE